MLFIAYKMCVIYFNDKSMYRKAEQILKVCKADLKKKALLITSQRQAGKTYIVREFGKANYQHYVEINFITTPSAKDIFSGDLNADTLIMNLTAFICKLLEKGKRYFKNGRMLEQQLSSWLMMGDLIILNQAHFWVFNINKLRLIL